MVIPMALEDKILPQQYRSVDIDNYTFLRKKEGGDRFLKVLLFLAVGAGLYIFTFVLFGQAMEVEDSYVASMYLIGGLIASTFVTILMAAILMSKNQRLNNSSHLYALKKDPGKFKIVDNFLCFLIFYIAFLL